MAQIDELFKLMIRQDASDLHITSGSPPFLRIHGEMVKLEYKSLNNDDVQALIFEILNEKQRQNFIKDWELDTGYAIEGLGRFRINVFMQRRGLGGVFRVIPTELKTVEELGLPNQVLKLADASSGLILVTGPTGSGKSTTMAAILNSINLTRKEHILTIEDPIEFVHDNQMSLVNQREVSSHTKSFANALKAALREDPDIILVGEMRDLETIELAMTAAETGHLVFGTLHTNNAAKTVDRIIDVFPDTQQEQIRVMLAESLRGVVAQQLFKREDVPGRVAALEILVNNSAVSNLIREGKTFQIPSAMQTGIKEGMITFERAMDKLVKEGKLTQLTADTFLGRKKVGGDEEAREPQKPQRPRSPLKPPGGTTSKLSSSSQQKRGPSGGPGGAPRGAPGGAPGRAPGAKPADGGGIQIYDNKKARGGDDLKDTAASVLKNFGFGKKKSG